jgi:hypothetical protein
VASNCFGAADDQHSLGLLLPSMSTTIALPGLDIQWESGAIVVDMPGNSAATAPPVAATPAGQRRPGICIYYRPRPDGLVAPPYEFSSST